jgi:hypothetical protein
MSALNDGDPYFDDAPEDEDELECPLCPHTVYVSPVDGDASLSEMVRHFLDKHHGQNVNDLLRRARPIEGGTR